MIVSTAAFLLVYSLLVPIGLYAHAVLGSGLPESDLVVPSLLGEAGIVPAFPAALIVVAMLAAAMSSLDSVLLVMASTWERDVISLVHDVTEVRVVAETRRWVAIFALITALLAVRPPGTIVSLTAFSGGLFAACFFPAVVLGLLWRRGDGASAAASIVIGFAVLVLWPLVPAGAFVHEVFPALGASTFVYVALALRHPPLAAADRLGTSL